jgi:hypothetical protein
MPEHVFYHQINKDHAYWSEKRRLGQVKGGNTAGLLTHFQGDEAVSSVLFDAGLGTIDGLHDLKQFNWRWPMSAFITHGHPDHHLELMILSELWCKRETPSRRGPLSVHCTQTTHASWLEPVHKWGYTGGKTLAHTPVTAGVPVNIGIFTIHAIDVDHFPGSVIYVVEFGENARHRVVIGWDMKTLPNPDLYPILKNPSLALLEANTWNALSAKTGHTSVEELVSTGFISELGATLGPNRYGIFLVHYGGGEDPEGMLTDPQLLSKFRTTYGQLAGTVDVAARGQFWYFPL